MSRKMHLAGFMRPVGIHTAWWKHPSADPASNFSWPILKEYAQELEKACFDVFFMADHLALMKMPIDALKRSATVSSFDPVVLLSALAAVTNNIGLIATVSTTYDDPYHVARRLASLDHLSGGRAGWNLVTTNNSETAFNFSKEKHMDHASRYERGREFFEVITGLWDCWGEDPFLMDKESGVFLDPEKIKTLDHKGKYFSVKGPLNIARPIQGWPVTAQAGSSEAGKALAADTAEIVFSNSATIAGSRKFYSEVKGKAYKAGRDTDHIKIMPGLMVFVGETTEEAWEKKRTLDNLIHVESLLPNLSHKLGFDISNYDLDKPLPEELPDTDSSKGISKEFVEWARRENLTLKELAYKAAGSGYLEMVGTAAEVVDQMEEWFSTEACDGFVVMFPTVPVGLNDFTQKIVPELQRRGLFRTEYEGKTLRENLGLPVPSTV